MAINQYPNGPVAPARQGGMMKGREGYPDASQMPEIDDTPVNPEDAPEDMKGSNPIVSALQTLQQFVAAKETAGDPVAGKLKEHLLGFVQTVAGAPAGGQAPEGGAMPPSPGKESPMPGKEVPMPPTKPGEGGQPEDTMEQEDEESPEDEQEDMNERMAKRGARPMGGPMKGAFARKLGREMNQGKDAVPFI